MTVETRNVGLAELMGKVRRLDANEVEWIGFAQLEELHRLFLTHAQTRTGLQVVGANAREGKVWLLGFKR